MKLFFEELFAYNHRVNQKLWEVFHANQDKTSEQSVKLYNHILNAHQIWNNRIRPLEPPFGIWQIHPLQRCKEIDQANYENALLILDRYDLEDNINYKNTRGQVFNNGIGDVLFHIINHSTYHRGQITAALRQNGIEPLVTDYIFYKR